MGLADDGVRAGLVTVPGHEVDADTFDAHAHDHTHGKKASWRVSAHDHSYRHPDDEVADALLNGHTHASAHGRLPWEVANPV